MKKLLGILVAGLLWCNVGFAKIEKCADKNVYIDNIIYPYSFKYISKTKEEIAIDLRKVKKIKEDQKKRKEKSNFILKLDELKIGELESKEKQVTYRSMDSNTQNKKFKNFLNQNKKIKLENNYYVESFKKCIREKELYPELFEAKY